MSGDLSLLYVTVPSPKEAEIMAQSLLDQNLIVCANIFPAHQSIYKWNGAVCTDPETLVLFKTLPDFVDRAKQTIEKIHPHKVPCISEIQGHNTLPAYLNWAKNSLKLS